MDEILKKLENKQNLSFEESRQAFENMMSGRLEDNQIHDFLTFSSAKGETSDERSTVDSRSNVFHGIYRNLLLE